MSGLRPDLKRLVPPVPGEDTEAQRETVIDWLLFIRDFGQLDTNQLILRAGEDDDFVHAAAAVAAIGGDAGVVYDLMRAFVVQRLFREEPVELTEPQPRGFKEPRPRISPYSAPLAFLREAFKTAAHQEFTTGRLHTAIWEASIRDFTPAQFTLSNAQMALLTTLWCRVFPLPDSPVEGEISIVDLSSNRGFTAPLLASVLDYVPLFIQLVPNSVFAVRYSALRGSEVPLIKAFVEGWTYQFY